MPDDATAATEVLSGLANRAQLARVLGVGQRTIIRYEHQGLPVIRRGRMRLYDVEQTRLWLRGELPRAEVRRGRPRTH